jgi:hypothetical protein
LDSRKQEKNKQDHQKNMIDERKGKKEKNKQDDE